ncbi:phage tail protein [Kribbella sp. NPDC055071]
MSIPGLSTAGSAVRIGGSALAKDAEVGVASPYGMTMWFDVTVSKLDGGTRSLGLWSGCAGLDVQLAPEGPLDEGGNYTRPRYLPGKLTYGKITLDRAMTKTGSTAVKNWLEEQSAAWVEGQDAQASQPWSTTVVIRLHSGLGYGDRVIQQWTLQDATAVGWTVPPFSTSGGGIAIEKLTLVHGGFLKPGKLVSQLQLVENDQFKLSFLCNPAKIALKKQRRVDTGKATVDAGVEVVDPDAIGVTLGDLRLEGVQAVADALPILDRWLELEKPAAKPSAVPTPAEGTPPKTCSLCDQVLPSPADPNAGGEPHVLRPVWGGGRGGLPAELVLKSFDLTYTRFTPDGVPSRASVSLTLQERTGKGKSATPKRTGGAPSARARVGGRRSSSNGAST